jgi:hypothetical protein
MCFREPAIPAKYGAVALAGARVVDCAGIDRYRAGAKEPHTHPLALVHRPALCGRAGIGRRVRGLSRLGRTGLTVTLFLTGTGISRCTVREAGLRPFPQETLLWLMIAAASLMLIRAGRVRS